jgi:hypothetical protein
MRTDSIRFSLSISASHAFEIALQSAPKTKALDGAVLVDLSFIYADYPAGTWVPLRDVRRGYLP